MLTWRWAALPDLTPGDVHAMLALRQAVFVIEQRCIYQDIDDADALAFHLLGWQPSASRLQPPSQLQTQTQFLCSYLRLLPPGVQYAECALGRIVTAPQARRIGLGRLLLAEGLRRASEQFPGWPVRISAQLRLQPFYRSFGFDVASPPYDEDGIMHLEMVRCAL